MLARRLLGRKTAAVGLLVALIGSSIALGIHHARKSKNTPPPRTAMVDSALHLAPEFQRTKIRKETSEAIRIIYPVNMVHRAHSEYFVCNYTGLYLLDLERGVGRELAPPKDLASIWNPTGLFYQAATQTLYVANYNGKNLLVVDASDPSRLKLERVLVHPEMKSPEGVSVTEDGRFIAVADYDGNSAFLFEATGELRWRRPVALCHGITFLATPEDSPDLVATSLSARSLIKFDFAGHVLKQVGNQTWLADGGYPYPTTVIRRKDGTCAVADAYRGQVCLIDSDLRTLATFGGNGPGDVRCNNPYACCWDEREERLFIVDTFKDRIVEVRPEDRAITHVYSIAEPGAAPGRSGQRFATACEVERLADPGQRPPPVENYEIAYASEVDHDDVVRLPFPHVNDVLGVDTWHPCIYGLTSQADKRKTCLRQDGFDNLFVDYPLRFVLARNYVYAGKDYLLLTSPQCKEVLVCGDGVVAPIPLRKDSWLVGDTLVGTDFVIPASRLIEEGARRIQAFRERLGSLMPLEAMRLTFFPKLTPEAFHSAVRACMSSPAGCVFANECLKATTTEEQCQAAERFLETCKTPQRTLYLPELSLAEMILCASAR